LIIDIANIMKSVHTRDKSLCIIKLATCDIHTYGGIRSYDKIITLVDAIYNGKYDIICVQGIYERNFIIKLINSVKTMADNKSYPLHIIPEIINTSKSNHNMTQNAHHNSTSIDDIADKEQDKMIISRYPIVSYTIQQLPDDGTKYIIANIGINGYMLSVANVSLSKDIGSVIFDKLRIGECEHICKSMTENANEMAKIVKKLNMIYKRAHVIAGNMNMIIQNRISIECEDRCELVDYRILSHVDNTINMMRTVYNLLCTTNNKITKQSLFADHGFASVQYKYIKYGDIDVYEHIYALSIVEKMPTREYII